MKLYSKLKQLTILQLMALLASIGILATVALQYYEHRKLRREFAQVVQASVPYKQAVQACIERKGNMAACSIPGKSGIPQDFSASHFSEGFIHSIQVRAPGKITVRSRGISLKGIDSFTYEIVASLRKNGQILWEILEDAPHSCTRYSLC